MSQEVSLRTRIRVVKSANVSLYTSLPEEFYPFKSSSSLHVEGVTKYLKEKYDVDAFYVGVQDSFVVYKQRD